MAVMYYLQSQKEDDRNHREDSERLCVLLIQKVKDASLACSSYWWVCIEHVRQNAVVNPRVNPRLLALEPRLRRE